MTCDPINIFSDLFPWSGGLSSSPDAPLPDTVDPARVADPPVYFAAVGALAPEGLELVLTNADLLPAADGATLDLTTVTAAAFLWIDETGFAGSWTATRSGAAVDALTLSYEYLTGDVAEAGRLRVIAALTYTGGVRRTGWFTLTIAA